MFGQTNRRAFIAGLGSAAAWLRMAYAQQSVGIRHIGVLVASNKSDLQTSAGLEAFSKALAARGWGIGQTVQIDYRWADGDVPRMEALAKELVDLAPDVLLGITTQSISALRRETQTIPIVFAVVSDPVGSGFVASFAHPGGNITGFVPLESSLSGKWVQTLKEIMPDAARAILMFNPETAPYFEYYLKSFEAAAQSSGIEPSAARVQTTADIEPIIQGIANRPHTGLILMPDAFIGLKRNYSTIIELARQYRIPTVYPYRFLIEGGGLISYGIDSVDLYRRAADYVDRILNGAKPSDLPVQFPTRFELIINNRVAKEIGLTVPPSLLARADEVIE